ncbi:MAG: hypothetical protein PHT33_10025 [bacterium]|nr:hypothetical protein [bacterium]
MPVHITEEGGELHTRQEPVEGRDWVDKRKHPRETRIITMEIESVYTKQRRIAELAAIWKEAMGLEIESDREEIISGGEGKKSNAGVERLYISADGTRVCTGAGWKEVKVGTVYETKEVKNKIGEMEIKVRDISYLSSFTDCHKFGEYLWSEVYQRGIEKAAA